MDTDLYWSVRGTYDEKKTTLSEMSKQHLEAAILDRQYNDFLSDRSDYDKDDEDKHGHGKKIPYIGWFWRHIGFHDLKHIPIGNCGGFVGFMANNKWSYPERHLTEDEAKDVISIIDGAMEASQKGGILADIIKNTDAGLDELWEYMQKLSV